MGFFDILGSLATQGANLQGNYMQGQAAGQEQQTKNFMEMLNATRQKRMDEMAHAQSGLDNSLKLHTAGYVPQAQAQQSLRNAENAQVQAPFAPGDMSGAIAAAVNAPRVQSLASGAQNTITNPSDHQTYAYDFDQSPTGMAEKKIRLTQQEMASRQLGVDAQKSKEKRDATELQNRQYYEAFKSIAPNHPLAKQPYDTNNAPAYAALYDTSSKAADRSAQIAAMQPHLVPVQGADGKVTYVPASQAAGMQVGKVGGAGGGMSAMGQGVQARLLGAVAEARTADERMKAYEDKMLLNPANATPGMLTQFGGKMATRNAGSHAISGMVGETLGENLTEPEYLQYVRDAGLMARATQLMSSRGGSEAMVSAEQLLNRAVPNKNGLRGSVEAARKSRSAIFGPVGGLMQALTPEQIQKVEAGLAALKNSDRNYDYKGVGSILDEARANAPTGPGSGIVRPAVDKATRWEQLKSGGLSPAAATAQVNKEFGN